MMSHIALLRGVNVAGNQMVAMADLRNLLTRLKFDNVQSLLQSGNLVFKSHNRICDKIERLLESEARKQLKLATEFFVRTAAELKEIIVNNPFPEEAEREPGHLVAM
ncbi:MAG TPA: DUF1697 domain-containing protein, partial [Humisphaera sp.]|nr:DUF1697 domain-containing protein [Humisphaera sp.]